MGGGNLPHLLGLGLNLGLSPRGRGKLGQRPKVVPLMRSIPAWAGETGRAFHWPDVAGVYPRVGGGNSAAEVGGAAYPGLSPRGRGKPGGFRSGGNDNGSIPAWAGETRATGRPGKEARVYPRVGGGNRVMRGLDKNKGGLSPRGRGKRCCPIRPASASWSIPAWAGETLLIAHAPNPTTVYPRVGGGNSSDCPCP